MVRVGVMGAAGYAGVELVRILLNHPDLELAAITSHADRGQRLDTVYPAFLGMSDLSFVDHDDPLIGSLDAVFLALPHTASMARVPALLDAGVAVFDLSADFRLPDPDVYQRWYGVEHVCPDLLHKAVYGLPELFGADIAASTEGQAAGMPALVACPGCYPTASTLAAWPLVQAGLVDGTIVVDAISGVTGAGRTPSARTHFCSADENLEAYGVTTHRHTPEIEHNLSRAGHGDHPVVFTPHLAPLARGLLSTVTMRLTSSLSTSDALALYHDSYDGSEFVSVCASGAQPRTANVVGTNRAQVAVAVDGRTGYAVATCAIDNLGKGAAGQAVQCANLIFGLGERRGLDLMPRAV